LIVIFSEADQVAGAGLACEVVMPVCRRGVVSAGLQLWMMKAGAVN
jgi:hypothetical protein